MQLLCKSFLFLELPFHGRMDGGFEGSDYKAKGFELERQKVIESMDGDRRRDSGGLKRNGSGQIKPNKDEIMGA